MYARLITYETRDFYVNFESSQEGEFYDIGKILDKPFKRVNEGDKDLLAVTTLTLSPDIIHNEREIYSLFDLLGDLGGVTEVIMIVFGFFLNPISEHKFNLIAAKRLFLAHTHDDKFFDEPNENDHKINKFLDTKRFPQTLTKEEKKDIK